MKLDCKRNHPAFQGAYAKNAMLWSLEKISEHPATFGAAASCLMAGVVRPLAISITPDCDKKNKQYAMSNSMSSALMKLAIAEAVAIPIENGIKKIDKNPENFLKKETMEKLMPDGAKAYKFGTQVIKSGANFLSAIPKSLLTVALIPVIMEKIFSKQENAAKKAQPTFTKNLDPVFDKVQNQTQPNFKGNFAANGVAKIINNKHFSDFAIKNGEKANNVARNMSMATDILLTATAVIRTKTSKKIEEEKKPALIYNNLIATGASLLFGYALDNAIQKGSQKQIDKFIRANASNPKLSKYIEGINILRPTVIFAILYYALLPMISTYMADKIDRFQKK